MVGCQDKFAGTTEEERRGGGGPLRNPLTWVGPRKEPLRKLIDKINEGEENPPPRFKHTTTERVELLESLLRRWHNEHPDNKRKYDLWCETANALGLEML